MSPEERQRMFQLCELIQTEKDRDKFLALVRELNELFTRKEDHLKTQPPTKKMRAHHPSAP
jgi:hypothetical protein